MHEGGHDGDLLVGNAEVVGEDIKDGVVVIEVGDGEGAGKGEKKVQWQGETWRVCGIVAASFGRVGEYGVGFLIELPPFWSRLAWGVVRRHFGVKWSSRKLASLTGQDAFSNNKR